MTTFAPGSGHRLALLDLGACYPAGSVPYIDIDLYVSAAWPGHTKNFHQYMVIGASLADLAANEAAVDAGANTPGVDWIAHYLYPGSTDSTGGGDSVNHDSGAQYAFPATARYVSFFVKPDFDSGISWYTNGASAMTLDAVGVTAGFFGPPASTTTCPAITPVADFSGTPLIGSSPLSVALTDESTNTPTSWDWDFGDGATSTAQNPTHVYATPGTYTVSLTATNTGGSDTKTKVAYVRVFGAHVGMIFD